MANTDKSVEETTVSLKLTPGEYRDQVDTHHILIRSKNQELHELNDKLRRIREDKEPLTKIKNTLQEEITKANKAINAKYEEVTLLKQKLRYQSLRQITDNIDRLEFQLSNNHYKPREEQKIRNEIEMLRRSTKTLREFEAKQAENQKYRCERTRLIDERNNNYDKMRQLYVEEDRVKKALMQVREVIAANRKGLDDLRRARPALEAAWRAEREREAEARDRRMEERRRLRQDQRRERQEERRKRWEEYEASREPFEEEKGLCRLLISYLQMSSEAATSLTGSCGTCTPMTPNKPLCFTPSTPNKPLCLTPSTPNKSLCLTPSTPNKSLCLTPSTPSTPFLSLPASCGVESVSSPTSPGMNGYYYKKDKEEAHGRLSKRERAKAKRQEKLANKVKELRHTPDVLKRFNRLKIEPPKNTDEVTAAIIALQSCLQHYNDLSVQNGSQNQENNESKVQYVNSEAQKVIRPTSLVLCSVGTPSPLTVTSLSHTSDEHNAHSTPSMNIPGEETQQDTSNPTLEPGHKSQPIVNGGNFSHAQINDLEDGVKRILISLREGDKGYDNVASSTESFFSEPMTHTGTPTEVNNNVTRTYATVAGQVGAGGMAV